MDNSSEAACSIGRGGSTDRVAQAIATPSIMHRGSTTWLLWMEGTVAHLGSVDASGVLTPARTWTDASGAWLVSTAQDVTVAVGRVGRVTVERVCP